MLKTFAMATNLYFKVNADYEELIRLENVAQRIKEEMSDFSGPKKEFESLKSRLVDVQTQIEELSQRAAKDYLDAFSMMDSYSPKFMKDFTIEAQAFSGNMAGYFTSVQMDYKKMLDELESDERAIGSIQVTSTEDLELLQQMKDNISSLKSEVQDCVAVCELQADVWRGMLDANVPTDVLDKVKDIIGNTQELENAEQRVIDKERELAEAEEEARRKAEGEEYVKFWEDALAKREEYVKFWETELANREALAEEERRIEEERSNERQQQVADMKAALGDAITALQEEKYAMNELFADDNNLSEANKELDEVIDKAANAMAGDDLVQMQDALIQANRLIKENREENDKAREDYVSQIQDLDTIIAKEREKLEVLRQQAAAAQEKVDSGTATPAMKIHNFLGEGDTSAFAAMAERDTSRLQEEADRLNQLYEEQRQVVIGLENEQESLIDSLDNVGQKMLDDADATQRAEAEREAYLRAMESGQETAVKFANSTDVLADALGQESAAVKSVKLDKLREEYNLACKDLEAVSKKLETAQKAFIDAQNEAMKTKAGLEQGNKTPADMTEATDKVAAQKAALVSVAEEYDRINGEVQNYKAQLDEASGHQVRMRTQIMNAREELMRMIDAGQAGTPEFYQLAQHAGSLRKQMQMANAQMQYFANPQRNLAMLKTTLQGAAGGFGMLTGLMGLFNSKSEQMAEIQTKIQSVMAVVVGLETSYSLIKKTSITRIGAEIAVQSLANMAKGVYAAVTGQATAAQIAFNAAMAANPVGAIIVVLMAAAAAIYGIAKALSTTTEEEKAAKAATEAMGSALESTMKSAANKINTFNKLRATYNANKNDLKKLTTEIINNKEAQNELGVTLKTVDDVHQFFTKHADAFVKASQYRAMALAAEQAEAELLGKTMSGLSKILNRLANGQEVNMNEFVDLAKEVGITEKRAKELAAAKGFYEERVGIFARNNIKYYGKQEDMQKASAELMTNFVEEQRKGMVAQILNAQRQWNTAQAEAAEATYSDMLKKNQTKQKKEKKTKEKPDHTEADSEDRDIQRQEDERKRALEAHKKRLQESLEMETDAAKKRKIQRDLDLLDSKEYYRDLELQRIAQEKKEYDAQHKKDKKKVSYYDTEQYKAHFLSEKDRFSNELNEMNLAAYESEMKFFETLIELESKLGEAQELNSALKSLEKYYDARVQMEQKYLEKREELRQAYEKGVIDESTYNALSANVDREEQNEKNKAAYEKFKNNPLFSVAMMSDNTTFDQMQDFRDQFNGMMENAMENATVADFKGILDSYVQLTNEMINKNPFGEMKAAAEDLYWAQSDLEDETDILTELYAKFGLDSSGNIEDAEGEMAKLKKGAEDSKTAFMEATRAREQAQQELAAANEAYTTAADEGKSKEELAVFVEEQRAAAQAVADALEVEKNARAENQRSMQAYAAAQNQVTLQEDKVRKKGMEVQAQQKRSDTATKKSIETVKKWASALKSAASEFNSPIATAINGMVDLTMTTLDSIQSIKKASDASVEGIGRTAQAVTKAVAILAIIQAAWQVINTIMSLFTGKGEKEYQQHISSLKGQVEALDYTFNALKEDMDKAWGTDAINAYIQAVETLNDKQRAQIELIRDQAAASHGHHSLTHYMKKNAGITDKELEQARNYIKELGGDVSGAWVTDWLYSLTAEQLREFMKSGIGTTIMGKLGGVKGTGDYSGDDWLSDMQAFADTAKTVEDLADEMAEKLNGISLDGLKDEFKSLVTTFETSWNDINNSFDDFMREGLYNNMRTKYDEEMESWYKELNELNKQRAEGMSDEEYRKKLAELRERYQKFVKQAQDEYQQSLTDAGVNVKNLEQSATTGGFESMSEDTGTELNGRFAALQAQGTVIAENTNQLLVITGSMHDIANELRDVQVNSYLELREISENTKKVVEPILTMQEDIKKIKENTESL